jgi:hypothetical protein
MWRADDLVHLLRGNLNPTPMQEEEARRTRKKGRGKEERRGGRGDRRNGFRRMRQLEEGRALTCESR